LRRVCCHPKLALPDTDLPSAKLEAFEELIGECVGSGRKALVFSQFVEMQKILAAKLDEMGIDYLWLHGGTKNRGELVESFQRKDGPPVFLISLKAGGTGLNLTRADTVIHYDPWWNPAAQAQATDRAYRIGQKRPVFVYNLIVAGSVEERMLQLQDRKRKLANAILEGGPSAGGFAAEDVDDLFAPLDSD